MEEVTGQGIAGTVPGPSGPGREGRLGGVTGDPRWVRTVRRRARLDGALTVFAAADGQPAGAVLLEDRIRPDARQTIRAIRHRGVTRIVLATGDLTACLLRGGTPAQVTRAQEAEIHHRHRTHDHRTCASSLHSHL